jgi:hypothetical protein
MRIQCTLHWLAGSWSVQQQLQEVRWGLLWSCWLVVCLRKNMCHGHCAPVVGKWVALQLQLVAHSAATGMGGDPQEQLTLDQPFVHAMFDVHWIASLTPILSWHATAAWVC